MVIRVVFFGTPEFAVPTFEALRASRHLILAAVTQPDRPRGRGQHSSDAPVKARAVAAGVPVLQPEKLRSPEFLDAIAAFAPDLGVVAAYGRILPEQLLAIPRLGMVNVHASLLPRYRGAAPVHRAVMNGDTETGVTIMRVVKALDAGPMLATAHRPIGADETSDAVERSLAEIGSRLLIEVINRFEEGPVEETPQDESNATYAPRITRDDGIVDWGRPAVAIHNQIRGLYPWPHASSFVAGRRLILWRSSALASASDASPGTIVAAGPDRLHVATGQGILAITQLQAEGRRPLPVREFLAGHPVQAGSRFTATP